MGILGYPLVSLVILLVIAAICAGLVQALVGFSVGGFLISLVLGFIGALLSL